MHDNHVECCAWHNLEHVIFCMPHKHVGIGLGIKYPPTYSSWLLLLPGRKKVGVFSTIVDVQLYACYKQPPSN